MVVGENGKSLKRMILPENQWVNCEPQLMSTAKPGQLLRAPSRYQARCTKGFDECWSEYAKFSMQ